MQFVIHRRTALNYHLCGHRFEQVSNFPVTLLLALNLWKTSLEIIAPCTLVQRYTTGVIQDAIIALQMCAICPVFEPAPLPQLNQHKHSQQRGCQPLSFTDSYIWGFLRRCNQQPLHNKQHRKEKITDRAMLTTKPSTRRPQSILKFIQIYVFD